MLFRRNKVMMMQELMYDVMTGAEEAGRGGWDVRNVCVSGSRQALLFIETAAVPAICGSRGHSKRTSYYY